MEVIDEEGRITKQSSKHLIPKGLSKEDITNLIDLNPINDAEILNILRLRYTKKNIFTNSGNTLIVMNPFEEID